MNESMIFGEIKNNNLRQSIKPTYDSKITGPRFCIVTRLDNKVICENKIPDPFVNHKIKIHWFDALRSLLRHGNIVIQFEVSGDKDIIDDVMELDENYIGYNSTRRKQWKDKMEDALQSFTDDNNEVQTQK